MGHGTMVPRMRDSRRQAHPDACPDLKPLPLSSLRGPDLGNGRRELAPRSLEPGYVTSGPLMGDSWCQVCGRTEYLHYKWACTKEHFALAYEIGFKSHAPL